MPPEAPADCAGMRASPWRWPEPKAVSRGARKGHCADGPPVQVESPPPEAPSVAVMPPFHAAVAGARLLVCQARRAAGCEGASSGVPSSSRWDQERP